MHRETKIKIKKHMIKSLYNCIVSVAHCCAASHTVDEIFHLPKSVAN